MNVVNFDTSEDYLVHTKTPDVPKYHKVGRRSILRAASAQKPTTYLQGSILAKSVYFGETMAVLGPNILIFSRGNNRFGTHISETT